MPWYGTDSPVAYGRHGMGRFGNACNSGMDIKDASGGAHHVLEHWAIDNV